MITKTKQDWSIGMKVKVGFLTLEVISMKNNEYVLKSTKNVFYSFTPYLGLSKLDNYGAI